MTIPGCEGCERGSRDKGVAVYRAGILEPHVSGC